MKKILAFIAIFLLNFWGIGGTYVYADCPAWMVDYSSAQDWSNCQPAKDNSSRSDSTSKPIEIEVTEKIPGMNCWDNIATGTWCTGEKKDWPECRKYKCTIQPGFGSVLLLLSGLIKYATFIVALLGVLMLVYSGIEMSISWVAGKKDDAKKRIEKILLGLVLLFMIGFILNSVAPWIYQ